MGTLVFNVGSGPLSEIQIGPADILATISAAYTISGWLGGLDGVRKLLSILPISQKTDRLLDSVTVGDVTFRDPAFHILTSQHGPVWCTILNITNQAFGGDRRTQVIGLTVCALAHEGDYHCAVTLFVRYLTSLLFEGDTEILGAIESQLREDTTMHRLMNEGVTLGLPDLFLLESNKLGLPPCNAEWRRQFFRSRSDTETTEWHMVAGLLKWLVGGSQDPYLTRSGLTARIAAYLKAIGYSIGFVVRWDGSSPLPPMPGPRCVVIVLGGSAETDPLMADDVEFVGARITLHYTQRTVGAMLHQSISGHTEQFPEVLQADFDAIYDSIRSRLDVSYTYKARTGEPPTIHAICTWKPSPSSKGISRSLAAIYFPLLADEVAPCYDRIAAPGILKHVKDRYKRKAEATRHGLTEEVSRFRVVSAAVAISLIGSLAPEDFRNTRHAVDLELETEGWLKQVCEMADGGFASEIPYSDAAQLLAMIHAAADPDALISESEPWKFIGWRSGIYCVLPQLLLDMKPSTASVGLACRDDFYANLRVHPDGSIHSSTTPIVRSLEDFIAQEGHSDSLPVVELERRPWIGPPQTTPPITPLYLGIEKPLHYNNPDLCFVGRMNGNVIATASVMDVLIQVARAFTVPSDCSHMNEDMKVLNVDSSIWAESKFRKLVGSEELPVFIPVVGDPSWALFLAGQTIYFQSCIVTGCIRCALHTATSGLNDGRQVVLIGYASV